MCDNNFCAALISNAFPAKLCENCIFYTFLHSGSFTWKLQVSKNFHIRELDFYIRHNFASLSLFAFPRNCKITEIFTVAQVHQIRINFRQRSFKRHPISSLYNILHIIKWISSFIFLSLLYTNRNVFPSIDSYLRDKILATNKRGKRYHSSH